MAGISVLQGAQPVEYVEETTFNTEEADASWNWIGLVQSFSPSIMIEEEMISYLPDGATGLNLEQWTAEKVSEMHEVDISYVPQPGKEFEFLQYFTGAAGGTSASLTPLQLGYTDKDNGEYQRLFGCVGEEWSMTISEDSVAEVDCSFVCASTEDPQTTDYVGTGSHSTEDTSGALTYDDLSNITWGGSSLNHAIESLTLTVSNDLEVVKDPDQGDADSHVAAIVPVNREITVELTLTYQDLSMAQEVRSFNLKDFSFDVATTNTTTFTVNDQAFPEFPFEFGPEDLVSDSVESVPGSGLTYTTS